MELFLFTVDGKLAFAAAEAGVAGFVVDWECRHKAERQRGADTQINEHTPEDLASLRASVDGPILCRINACGPQIAEELDVAVENGADEILLPMVREPADVELALKLLRGRRPLGILVETQDAVACAADLAQFPLSRVYVGLNDLAIDRGVSPIFTSLADGTVDEVRRHFSVPFGVAGATVPERGWPIPAHLLISEITRLDCSFTFLRRSFFADVPPNRMREHVPRILQAFEAARERTTAEIARDREQFVAATLQPA